MQVSFSVPDEDGNRFLSEHPTLSIGNIAKHALYQQHGMEVPQRGSVNTEQDSAELTFLAIKARSNHNRLGAVDFTRMTKLATRLGKSAEVAHIRESSRN